MKKINILLLLLIIASLTLKAQESNKYRDLDRNEKFLSIIQLSYIKNYEARNRISLQGQGTRDIDLNTDNAHAYSLNFIFGYFVIPKRLSIGIGFGLDGYHEPGFNSAPLYGDFRFFLTNERNVPYIYTNLGGLLKLGSTFRRGQNARLGFGYKFFISQKLCLNTDISYVAKGDSLTNESVVTSDDAIYIKGVALSIGFTLF